MADAPDGSIPWVSGQTLGDVLKATVAAQPDRDALVFPALGLRWSWSELERRVEKVARALVALGIRSGEHVGIWAMNCPEWVVTQLAVARTGAVLVNVNPGYRLYELEDALRMADVRTLVVGRTFKNSNFVEMVHTVCPEAATTADAEWSCAALPELKRLIALGDRPGPGWLCWDDLVNGPECSLEELTSRENAISSSDVVNIQFTSGTTGLPKGAMLSHANLLLNSYWVGRRLRYRAEDRVCVPVPFYHCFGCVLGTIVCAVYGSTIVVPAPAPDADATLAALAAERCTSVYGVPTIFVSLLGHPSFDTFDLSHLRTGIVAGAPCPMPLMEEVVSRMGLREICIGYGQTEASPIITFTSADDPIEIRCGTVGRPLSGIEVKLVDPATGALTPQGESGELCARGHNVMAGYYNNPTATAKAIDVDGWLHTGDMARCQDDGNYRIVGRCKELINRGGEKIYPPEVEEFLHHHPDVAEAAVAGLPDAKYGEIVAAWIVPREGAALTSEAIRTHCQGRITHYKVPEYVAIVKTLPRTATYKVKKHVLRQQAIDELGLGSIAGIETA
jgi:fatty-acyl-CoA synthase